MAGLRFVAADAGVAQGEAVHVLLRPEDLRLAEPGAGRVDGAVETCAFFGAHYEVTVRTALGLLRLRHERSHGPGQAVAVAWPAEAGIAYPAEGPGRAAALRSRRRRGRRNDSL